MGRKGTAMTSVAWNSLAYYGRSLKRDFSHLDTLITQQIEKKSEDQDIDTLLKMMKHKTTVAITVTRIVDLLDTTKRIENIERLIQAITPEALAEAQKIIAK